MAGLYLLGLKMSRFLRDITALVPGTVPVENSLRGTTFIIFRIDMLLGTVADCGCGIVE